MKLYQRSLKQLLRARERISKMPYKDPDAHFRALAIISKKIMDRGRDPVRSSLPKKKQRELGMLPPIE